MHDERLAGNFVDGRLYTKPGHGMDNARSDFVTANETDCISFLPSVWTSERFTTHCGEADAQAYHVGCSLNTGVRCTITTTIRGDRKTGVTWHVQDSQSDILHSARCITRCFDCSTAGRRLALLFSASLSDSNADTGILTPYHYRCFWMMRCLWSDSRWT